MNLHFKLKYFLNRSMKTIMMAISLVAVLVVSSIGFGIIQDVDGLKGEGVSLPRTGSDSPVCGDRLCSESVDNVASKHTENIQPISTDVCTTNEGKTRTFYIAADEVVWDCSFRY